MRLFLLDRDKEYGDAFREYLTRRKNGGISEKVEFFHVETVEALRVLLGPLIQDGEETVEEQYHVLLGEGFFQRDLGGVAGSRDMKITAFTADPASPIYKYGRMSELLKALEQDAYKGSERVEGREAGPGTIVVTAIGMTGGVGVTTMLHQLQRGLVARGFRVASIDLDPWAVVPEAESGSIHMDHGYLRFLSDRGEVEFHESLERFLEGAGEDVSLKISSGIEIGPEFSCMKKDLPEIVEKLKRKRKFDFLLLDMEGSLFLDGLAEAWPEGILLLTDWFEAPRARSERFVRWATVERGWEVLRVSRWREKTSKTERMLDQRSVIEFNLHELEPEPEHQSPNRRKGLLRKRCGAMGGTEVGHQTDGVEGLADHLVELWMKRTRE